MLRLAGKELAAGRDRRHSRIHFASTRWEGRGRNVRGIGSEMKNQTRDWSRTWHGEPMLDALLEVKKGETGWGRNRWSSLKVEVRHGQRGREWSTRGELGEAAPHRAEQRGTRVGRGATGCARWDILTSRAGSGTELPWGWPSRWLSPQRICLLCCLPQSAAQKQLELSVLGRGGGSCLPGGGQRAFL